MSLFIGIDGGGSKTKCILLDEKLNVLSQSDGGPSNPLTVGYQDSAHLLFELIRKVSQKFGIEKISSITIGIAGGGREKNSNELRRTFIELCENKGVKINSLYVTSDAEVAIEGAFSGKVGAILIAGTGSIIFAKDKEGNFIRAGGYGKIFGDEGSGFSIGRKGLSAISKNFDGRGKKTILSDVISNEFVINNRDDLIAKVYNEKFDVAGFAPYLISAAEKGDLICRTILNGEIRDLLHHIKAVKKNMHETKMKLCLGGGLLSSDNYYSQELRKKIKKTFTDVKLTNADYPPEIGAALLAMKNFSNSIILKK
jgi:N-acetylglucosamine kinase-like BadF-type ATPase